MLEQKKKHAVAKKHQTRQSCVFCQKNRTTCFFVFVKLKHIFLRVLRNHSV